MHSPQQQSAWDNQSPVVVRANNQAPVDNQLLYILPQGVWNQQWSGQQWQVGSVAPKVSSITTTTQNAPVSPVVNSVVSPVVDAPQYYILVDQQSGGQLVGVNNQAVGAVTTPVVGVQDQVVTSQVVGVRNNVVNTVQDTVVPVSPVTDQRWTVVHQPAQPKVDNIGTVVTTHNVGTVGTVQTVPQLVPQIVPQVVPQVGHTYYAIVANQHGDSVVTNEQPIAPAVLPAVNFDNLRPGNVRRLEEPLDTPVFNDGTNENVDSFDEPVADPVPSAAPVTVGRRDHRVVGVRNEPISKVHVVRYDEQQQVSHDEQQQQQEVRECSVHLLRNNFLNSNR